MNARRNERTASLSIVAMAALLLATGASPAEGRLRETRVHHLRENSRLFDYAIRQTVELIGIEDLAESSRLLGRY